MTLPTKFSGSTCPRCNSTCAVWPHVDDELHCVICGATFYLERAQRPFSRTPVAEAPVQAEEPIRRRVYQPEPELDALAAEGRRSASMNRRRYGTIWDEMAGMEEYYRWNLRGA